MGDLQEDLKDMSIESLQDIIRKTLKDFEMYDEEDEDLVNALSERILESL